MITLNNTPDITFEPAAVFADPVAYLEQFEIECAVVDKPADQLPLAA